MEIPPVVNLEEHQSRTVLGFHKLSFSTQESSLESASSSANDSLDHRGDDCLPEAQCLLLAPDKDVPKLKKRFEFVETAFFKEPEQVSVSSREASPGTAQLREAQIMSITPASNQDCCGNFSIPAPAAEVQSNRVAQSHPGQILELNCECVKSEFKKLEPITNGSNLNLDSTPTIMVPATVPDSGRRVLDLPHIVKHKQSYITFSDCTCPSTANYYAFNKSSDDGESSQEGEKEEDDGHHDGDDDDDDDVFPELPHNTDFLVSHRRRNTGRDKQKRKSSASARPELDHTPSSCCYEAIEETSSKEESPQVKSPWSESMSQLMRKLDQLNLDIEEALSASSSPSDTPCTPRKTQWGAVSKSTLNQTLNDQVLQRPDREECQSRDTSSAPRSSSVGTRARTKKTMFNKMTNAAGAAVLGALSSSLTQGRCLLLEADCDLRQLQSLSGDLLRTVIYTSQELRGKKRGTDDIA